MIKYNLKMATLFMAICGIGYLLPAEALTSNDPADVSEAHKKETHPPDTNLGKPEPVQNNTSPSGIGTTDSKVDSSKKEPKDTPDSKKGKAVQADVKPKVHPSELDRHWIIKMKKKDLPPAPKQKVDWASKDQKQACEVIGGQMQEVLRNVKYFVVRGDECSTAKYADQFLKVTKQCQDQCPESFFYARGFNPQIVRNVKTLSELGRKLCLDRESRQPDNKKKSDANK